MPALRFRPRPGSGAGPRRTSAWVTADVVLILAFATAGRRTHEHGLSAAGVLETAGPFLLAYAIAALLLRTAFSPATLWPTGIVLWLATAGGGLALRFAFGAGVALSFQVVTLGVLGVLLLLPRVVAVLLRRRRRSGSVGGEIRPSRGTP